MELLPPSNGRPADRRDGDFAKATTMPGAASASQPAARGRQKQEMPWLNWEKLPSRFEKMVNKFSVCDGIGAFVRVSFTFFHSTCVGGEGSCAVTGRICDYRHFDIDHNGDETFLGCTALRCIEYRGTVAQRESVVRLTGAAGVGLYASTRVRYENATSLCYAHDHSASCGFVLAVKLRVAIFFRLAIHSNGRMRASFRAARRHPAFARIVRY